MRVPGGCLPPVCQSLSPDGTIHNNKENDSDNDDDDKSINQSINTFITCHGTEAHATVRIMPEQREMS